MSERHRDILRRILADRRYQANLDWGEPRPGHPEGTIRAHIADLEANLERLRRKLDEERYWKLKIAIHVHDTFKPQAADVPIADAASHASLARGFLAEFTDDAALLHLVQFHDEPYALWRGMRKRGEVDRDRLERLVERVGDWDLFLAFLIVDGCTAGKGREQLRWFFRVVHAEDRSVIGDEDIAA
jgi:hypothetical protein